MARAQEVVQVLRPWGDELLLARTSYVVGWIDGRSAALSPPLTPAEVQAFLDGPHRRVGRDLSLPLEGGGSQALPFASLVPEAPGGPGRRATSSSWPAACPRGRRSPRCRSMCAPAACSGKPSSTAPTTPGKPPSANAVVVMRPPNDLPPASSGSPGQRARVAATTARIAAVATATGQLELPLDVDAAPPAPAGEIHVLRAAGASPVPAIAPAPPLTADDWFARALGLEDTQAPAAIDAYRRALRQRPEWVEAWVNLGRLLAESDDPSGARECFESALALDPADATALYNLGVVAQDTGCVDEAIAHYGRALELDDALAEAHYNLATLFDQQGDGRAAIRHINAYRKLTRGS